MRAAFYGLSVFAVIAAGYLYFQSASARGQSDSLVVLGSETMRAMVSECADSFMARNPNAVITVKGGGSGDGLTNLLLGMTDMGMTSRPLLAKETGFARSKGIDLTLTAIAQDGVAIIVHPSSTIASLTLDQTRAAFSGNLARWSMLAVEGRPGPDLPVVAIARAAGSGTAALFAQRVLTVAETLVARQLPTNEAIVAEVADTPGAIGYTGLGALRNSADRVKVLAIKASADTPAITPTVEAVSQGRYPLSRALFFATVGEQSGIAERFIAHCAGPAGQEIVQKAGYITPKKAKP